MQRSPTTFIHKQNIINSSYIKKIDIQNLYAIGPTKANEIFKKVIKTLKDKQIPFFEGRSPLAPINIVLELYPVDAKRINAGARIERETNEK